MRWPKWCVEMAKRGDLLMIALTGVQADPEYRIREIFHRLAALRAEEDALTDELFALKHDNKFVARNEGQA